jgi:hypothetical protein
VRNDATTDTAITVAIGSTSVGMLCGSVTTGIGLLNAAADYVLLTCTAVTVASCLSTS